MKKYCYSFFLFLHHIKKHKTKHMGVTTIKGDRRVIVSLTSFPERINSVHKCLCSILNQKYKPNDIILWLAEEQFPEKEKELPAELLQLRQYGLSIRWTSLDMKSYKKILPALKEFSEDIIITADDDLYYPDYWLGSLLKSYNEYPHEIHCHLITPLTFNGENNVEKTSRIPEMINSSSYLYKLLSGSGTLFPPNCFGDIVLDFDRAYAVAPTSDDIWLWANAVKNGYKIRWIADNMKELYYVEGTQENTPCLWKINDQGEHLFDIHLRNVINDLEILDILLKSK